MEGKIRLTKSSTVLFVDSSSAELQDFEDDEDKHQTSYEG
jgi:hypothetical protein